MTKIVNCIRNISPFGGINLVIDQIKKKKIDKIIDDQLGQRAKQAKFSYSDIFLSWVYANLCGADRLEDVMAIKDKLEYRPGFKCPSSDSISLVMRSLSTKNTIIESKTTKGLKHEFNINMPLSQLLIKTALKLKELNKTSKYTLDYDNTIIFTEKYDSKMTYKMDYGYQPGVMLIGPTPVYIENRNGNATASSSIDETIKRGLDLLEENGVKIERFRSDSAGYVFGLIKSLQQRNIKYYIRGSSAKNDRIEDLNLNKKWERIRYHRFNMDISEYIEYNEKVGANMRYVIYRKILGEDDGVERVKYFSICTNDFEMSMEAVLRFYNQRGAEERYFDDLKNNFNWSRLPFSFLHENTVFLIVSAMASVIYRYCLKLFSKMTKFVKNTWRLKNFIFHYISVAAWWEDKVLYLDTHKDYGGG